MLKIMVFWQAIAQVNIKILVNLIVYSGAFSEARGRTDSENLVEQ